MAGALAAGLIAVVLAHRTVLSVLAAAASVAAFAATLLTPDTLAATVWVDGVLYSAFRAHPLAGGAVAVGALALVIPAAAAGMKEASGRHVFLAFGACWAAVLAAAALGNYPTPLVGYGGSAVLGYLLSVALLPQL